MDDKTYSIILCSYFSEERIENVFHQIKARFEQENIDFELVIIDDGSKDGSFKIAKNLETLDSRVKAYQLSRNYTAHYAVFAGLSVCSGACAVPIPDDFQLPLDTIVEMYRLWELGHKLVVPYRETRDDGKVSDFFSHGYYKVMNFVSDVTFPPGGADSFLADREIIDILNERIHAINTSTIIEALRLGFDPYFLPFHRPKATTKSRWTHKKKIRLAKDTFYSSSSFPIKLISKLGYLSILLSFILIITSVYLKLTEKESLLGVSVPGWTSLVIIISFFSGLILFGMGMIAEYVWRIFEEVKNRPGYIIRQDQPESERIDGEISEDVIK